MTLGAEIAAVKYCVKIWKWRAELYGKMKEKDYRIRAMEAVLARLEAIRRDNTVERSEQ